MCIREGDAVSTPSAGANKGLKTPTLGKWRTQKVDRPMEAICGDRGDMVIFLPSQTLEGPPHLSLPAASGAQVCLHSAFQCFHLLLIMLWAQLTGKKTLYNFSTNLTGCCSMFSTSKSFNHIRNLWNLPQPASCQFPSIWQSFEQH